jgi:hypothetical protein
MLNVDAVLFKGIGDRWYTLLGCASQEYSDHYYARYALPSDSRDAAIAHAQALAVQKGIPLSRIIEDRSTAL